MKHLTAILALTGIIFLTGGQGARAGAIERACLKADRNNASRTLCDCIEDVAKPMFSRSEMRQIAKFFEEPHLSQELRQSDSRADENFWRQYQAWGEAVQSRCD